jgi:predicted porin
MKRSVTIGTGALLFLIPVAVSASDHHNLDEGLPLLLRDAYPIGLNGIEAQGLFRYERGRRGKGLDAYRFEPRLEWGAFRDGQLAIRLPYTAGNSEKSGQGLAGASLLYNFNQEGLLLPAFALEAEVAQRFGERSGGGAESTLWAIATKSIGGYSLRRINLNLGWTHRYDPQPLERRDLYTAVVGFQQALGPDTMLVVNYVREQQERRQQDANIVGVGFRYQLNPRTVLSLGGGVGIGRDSPAVQAIVGVQYSLSWPPN